ncbi:MAG: hypothetical protein QOF30_2922 [Acidimicrobiaceae bacterium]|nr:hypothetical protein [Acidimicrobiaceae bacterium]
MSFSVRGAWTRESVSIAGSEAFETQLVYWLQAGPCYADIRVPFHPAGTFRCFAGRSGWRGDDFRWTHRLDLEGSNPEDVGRLFWEEGRLVERGWFGDVTYEEVWLRLDDDKGPFLAAEGPGECLVRVGEHAVTIVDDRRDREGALAACYQVLSPAGWEIRAAIGDTSTLPSPSEIPPEWLPVEINA